MIGKLCGTLADKAPPQIVIDVGGVGYEVDVPMSTFYELPPVGEAVSLYTHMVVREDALLLYGFLTSTERRFFRLLLRVSGVGARMALGLLSGLSVDELRMAVYHQDYKRLIQVPGIGKKTAERLLLELRDRLEKMPIDTTIPLSLAQESNDILNALTALGYSDKEALNAVRALPDRVEVAEGIRQALQWLAGGAK